MLKIKKTKPYQFRKSRRNSTYKTYAGRVVCATALICGIVPSLALLNSYNVIPVSAARKTLSNITTMQEMTTDICNNSALGQSNTLIDIRDNSTYTVARLSDGNCWMTQNLRLSRETLATTGHSTTLTNADTDVSEDYELPVSGAWTSGDSTAQGIIASTNNDYGAYYSWCAATAGTCQSNGALITENTNATSSICPKGWRLPTGGSDSEYQTLNAKGKPSFVTNGDKNGYWLGGTSSGVSGASFFLAAGGVSNGNHFASNIGSSGQYISSTAGGSFKVCGLYFSDSYFSPDNCGLNKYSGASVRCLAPASSTDFPDRFDEKDVEVVAVRVSPVISIDATSGMKEEVDPNKITTGTISATVSANTTYAVQLSANKTSLTNSQNPEETEITNTNSIPASSNVAPRANAWGILNQDNTTYSAITTNPTTYYNTEEYNDTEQSTKHTFSIGVSISPTLPAGEYSTTVTITAVNN